MLNGSRSAAVTSVGGELPGGSSFAAVPSLRLTQNGRRRQPTGLESIDLASWAASWAAVSFQTPARASHEDSAAPGACKCVDHFPGRAFSTRTTAAGVLLIALAKAATSAASASALGASLASKSREGPTGE